MASKHTSSGRTSGMTDPFRCLPIFREQSTNHLYGPFSFHNLSMSSKHSNVGAVTGNSMPMRAARLVRPRRSEPDTWTATGNPKRRGRKVPVGAGVDNNVKDRLSAWAVSGSNPGRVTAEARWTTTLSAGSTAHGVDIPGVRPDMAYDDVMGVGDPGYRATPRPGRQAQQTAGDLATPIAPILSAVVQRNTSDTV
jgi:hypothetical protein